MIVCALTDADKFQKRYSLSAKRRLLGDGRTRLQEMREEPTFQLQVEPDHDVVDDRKLAEQPDALKRAGYTVAGHVVRSLRGQHLVAECHSASTRSKHATHHIDEGALAGAIRANQTVHTSTLNRNINPAQSANAAKILGLSVHRQHRLLINCITREIEHTWITRNRGPWAPP